MFGSAHFLFFAYVWLTTFPVCQYLALWQFICQIMTLLHFSLPKFGSTALLFAKIWLCSFQFSKILFYSISVCQSLALQHFRSPKFGSTAFPFANRCVLFAKIWRRTIPSCQYFVAVSVVQNSMHLLVFCGSLGSTTLLCI